MGAKGSGKMEKTDIVKLSGEIQHQDGSISKTTMFDFLNVDLDDYSDIEMNAEEAQRFTNHVKRMKTGLSAFLPKLCPGPMKCPMGTRCPFDKRYPLGRACHPPGTLVKTINRGDIPIENLDPELDKLLSLGRKRSQVKSNRKQGFPFDLSSKEYSGLLINITTDKTSHMVTPDHISIARFNENAVNKFCVYLMRKGDCWRIGKSTFLNQYKNGLKQHKYWLGFSTRGTHEDADAMWILGIYNTNTEALLAEERFSIEWQTTKVSFVDSLLKKESKYNGLYKWATREQIQEHHDSLAKPESFYKEKLKSINRSIDFPIWEATNSCKQANDVKLFSVYPMFIRACNLIPEIMDTLVYPSESTARFCDMKASWTKLSLGYEEYNGPVYALDVHGKYKTYFANDIATHNCPLEVGLIKSKTREYIDTLDIDPGSPYEMSLIDRLVELDVFEYRSNIGLSGEDESSLLHTEVSETKRGELLENVVVSPYIAAKDSFHRKRMHILEALVATRKEEYKKAAQLKKKDSDGISSQLSDVRSLIEKMNKAGGSIGNLDKLIEEVAETPGDPNLVEADWETVPND